MTIVYAMAAILLVSFAIGCISAKLGLPTWLTAILGAAASILAMGVVQHL